MKPSISCYVMIDFLILIPITFFLITYLKQIKDFIHSNREKHRENFYPCAFFLVDFWAVVENFLGSQPYAFGPVYSNDEHVSDPKDRYPEENSDSERVGNDKLV